MPPRAVQRKASAPLMAESDIPMTAPTSLTPIAAPNVPPGSVPKSCIPLVVQTNGCEQPQLEQPEYPTTQLNAFMPLAKLKLPPGSVPKSCIPLSLLQRKARY